MSEQAAAQPKRTLWRRLGLLAGILLLLTVGPCAWLSLRPRGYAAFESAGAGDLARVNGELQLASSTQPGALDKPTPADEATPSTPSQPDLMPAGASTPSTSENGTGGPVDFIATVTSLGWRGQVAGMDQRFLGHGVGGLEWDALYEPPSTSGAAADEGRLRNATSETLRAFRRTAGEIRPGRTDYLNLPDAKLFHNPQWRNDNQARLKDGLDRVETFLLRQDWTVRPFETFPYFPSRDGFAQLTALAVLRADRQGDGERASRLLERYLEAWRLFHLGRFPVNDATFYFPGMPYFAPAPLLVTAECRHLPPELAARLGRVLDRALLDEAAFHRYLSAWAVRAGREIRERRLTVQEGPTVMKTWSNLTLYALLRPAAAGLVERATFDLNQGRSLTFSQLLELELMKQALPVQADHLARNPYPFLESIGATGRRPGPEGFNQDVHLMRLVLATAAYRRKQGHYPDSLEDLVPAYLDRDFAESPAINWTVYRVEPPTRPTATDKVTPGISAAIADAVTTVPAPVTRPVFVHAEQPHSPYGDGDSRDSGIRVTIGCPLDPLVDERVLDLME